MKQIPIYLSIALFAMACAAPASKTTDADTSTTNEQVKTPAITSLCFLHTEGTKSQDSTAIELVINGDKVTGEMHWMPYEKDSRKGLLTGIKNGDTIKAVWVYQQEGVSDSIALAFKLSNHQLLQKPLKADAHTGRQTTDESADYRIIYQPFNGLKQ